MNVRDFQLGGALQTELEAVIAARRLPHAVIIENGDDGERLRFARFLAAAALCEGSGPIPCGECRHCKKVFAGIHPDVETFEREADKKEFSVKIIRDAVRPSVYIKPNEAQGRVCILRGADAMNVSAQNALLKILEEPPANVRFFLLCDTAGVLLETIRSRATVYSLPLRQAADDDRKQAAELAEKLAASLTAHTEYAFLAQTGALEKNRPLLTLTLEALQTVFRNAVFIQNGVEVPQAGDAARLLAQKLRLPNLLKLTQAVNELNDLNNKNANLNLLITRLCSELRQCARS